MGVLEKIREYLDRLTRFLKEVRQEIKKVTWPQQKDVIGSTIVVIAAVFVVSFFLGLIDVTLQKLLSYIIR